MNARILLFSLLVFVCSSTTFFAHSQTQSSEPILRIGLFTDAQYADVDTHRERFYRLSLEKIDEVTTYFNDEKVDFTINLGDLVDRNPADIDLMMNKLKSLKKKLYNIPGNHDYSGFVDNNMLFKKLKMPNEYYSFIQKKWRFIMLNTNEVASYANIEASNKEKELLVMKDSIDVRGGENNKIYNGGISSMQMAWLKNELAQAEKKNENIIVCTHHPLYPASSLSALNDKEILDTLAESKNVKLVLSGHDHAGAFGTYKDIPCVTLEGMLETEINAYGTMEVHDNKIVIVGKGRMSSRQLEIK